MICTLPQVSESRGLQPLCCDLCVVTFVLCVLLRTLEHVARCSWWGLAITQSLIYVLRDTGVIGSTGQGQIHSIATHLHFHVRWQFQGFAAPTAGITSRGIAMRSDGL